MPVCMHVCIHVCMHVCMYACIHALECACAFNNLVIGIQVSAEVGEFTAFVCCQVRGGCDVAGVGGIMAVL